MNELFVGSLARASNGNFDCVYFAAAEGSEWRGMSGAVPRDQLFLSARSEHIDCHMLKISLS